MALLTKPNMQQVWASGGDIVEPSDLKKQQGWTVEVPPHQFENWIQNRQDEYLAHINQRGIPAWDGLTNYEAGGLSYVQGIDGKVYKSVAASGPSSVVSNPTTDGTDTYWTIAFADVGAFLTQATGDTRYTQRSNNLSDVTNVATARTNLGAAPLASPAFTGTPTAVTASPGTSTTQLASTAFVQAAVGVGNVSSFAMATPPTGWLKANGAAVNRATYAALFAAIGTTFGAGDGSTTFNVPDMRGEFPRGWDDSRGVDSARAFGSSQLGAMQGHNHGPGTGTFMKSGINGGINAAVGANATYTGGDTGGPTSDGINGTPLIAAETRPRSVALLYCIKY